MKNVSTHALREATFATHDPGVLVSEVGAVLIAMAL